MSKSASPPHPRLSRHIIMTIIMMWSTVAHFHSLHAQLQHGKASFYSLRSTGSRTASGERLHHDSLTCAHRSLPFGTFLKVTNQTNGQSVIVRINDRGPYVRGRIIDLTWRAAKEIGMLMQGIAYVTVEQAYTITFPLRPPGVKIEVPKLEIINPELPDTLKAIWQEDELIEHRNPKAHPKK